MKLVEIILIFLGFKKRVEREDSNDSDLELHNHYHIGNATFNFQILVSHPHSNKMISKSINEADLIMYMDKISCSTINSETEMKKDPLILDEKPLKHFLIKMFSWVKDVSEVRYSRSFHAIEIHLTVSPIHHSELMNPSVERKVSKKLYEVLLPLLESMYEIKTGMNPVVIFSPEPSQTILEVI